MTNTNRVTNTAHTDYGDGCGQRSKREERIDEALEQSFPASDPPSFAQPMARHEGSKGPAAAAALRQRRDGSECFQGVRVAGSRCV